MKFLTRLLNIFFSKESANQRKFREAREAKEARKRIEKDNKRNAVDHPIK